MNRVLIFLVLAFVLVGFLGCSGKKSEYSNEQRKEMETRIVEADVITVFQAVISVLQDKGYVISHTDSTAGMITGDSGSSTGLFGITRKHEVSAIVQSYGKGRARVRITFRQQSSYGSTNWLTGAAQQEAQVYIISTPEMLTEVYEAVEKEVFERKSLDG